ncbi:porin [Janthinobacterium sp. PC23-8]|uniref:porin n=1 Tax=Janthinobacterium sp. PC23-8 TaxID=2012679 RepID=UPI0020CCEE03|nr:porin [Janthinobacterium sp. PC23-8]
MKYIKLTRSDVRASLAILVCATLSVAAHGARAQGNVTLYGIADIGIEHLDKTSAGGTQTSVVSGNSSGSRWGVKGEESIGEGLRTLFVLESGFNLDDGTSAQSTRGLGSSPATTTRLFGRQALVGFNASGQQLTLGRQMSLLYEQAVLFDPMATNSRYSILSFDTATANRIDNSVKYAGRFQAFTVQAMYSTRYDTGYGNEIPGASPSGRFYSGALTYAAGPLGLSVSYEQRNSNTVATDMATERRSTAAVSYVAGPFKGFAGYRYLRASSQFLPVNPILAANASQAGSAGLAWAGAQYTASQALVLTVAAYHQDVHASGADPLMAVLWADYFLSKRVDLYATAAFARNKNGSALGVNGYGTVTPGTNQTGVVVGMRYKF